jgi:hypothetical protein
MVPTAGATKEPSAWLQRAQHVTTSDGPPFWSKVRSQTVSFTLRLLSEPAESSSWRPASIVPLSCLLSRHHDTVQPGPGTAGIHGVSSRARLGSIYWKDARTALVWTRVHPAWAAPTLSEECGAYSQGNCTRRKARLPRSNFVLHRVGSMQGLRRSFAGQPDLGFARCRCDGTLTAGCGAHCVGARMR